jgi:hypothetical protein
VDSIIADKRVVDKIAVLFKNIKVYRMSLRMEKACDGFPRRERHKIVQVVGIKVYFPSQDAYSPAEGVCVRDVCPQGNTFTDNESACQPCGSCRYCT